jgi:hypothetical protein
VAFVEKPYLLNTSLAAGLVLLRRYKKNTERESDKKNGRKKRFNALQ